MNALTGYTGFVGSNLYASGQFDAIYNSKNKKEAYGTKPELLVYAGLRSEKYLANQSPQKDMEQILEAEENIRLTDPKKLVLISTIDVFKNPSEVNETSTVNTDGLHAYGYNRYQLELWVRKRYPDALIVRLPGLFGRNIKKNFIYDYIHFIPNMLTACKMSKLSKRDTELEMYYQLQENGFYKVKELTFAESEALKERFRALGFSALNFTDSRSVYQFYNLERLWSDIQTALKADVKLLHLATEPVSAGEIYEYLTGETFVNKLDGIPAYYDYRTIYDEALGGKNGYLYSKEDTLKQLKNFVEKEQKTLRQKHSGKDDTK